MPMTHVPGWPPDVLIDEFHVVVDIYTETDGAKDARGNPLPPQKQYYVQDAPADLQPKGGTQRAMQSATMYELTHTLFFFPTEGWPPELSMAEGTSLPAETGWPADTSAAVLVEAFFGKLAGQIPAGAIVEARNRDGTARGTFQVVFVACWGTHLEIDLKAV